VIVNPVLPRPVRVRGRGIICSTDTPVFHTDQEEGGESSQLFARLPDTEVTSAAFHRMIEGPFWKWALEIRLFRQLKSFLLYSYLL
jgi:hypothetical protein